MWHKFAQRIQSSPVLRGVSSFSLLRFGTKFLTLARLAFVARFLSPSEIGSYQLALLIIAVGEVFTETGINIMLLKSPKKLEEYLDTAWVVAIIRGTLIAGAILLLTNRLSLYYQSPALATFLYVSALIPFFRGFINPAIIGFQQNLQFGRESVFRLALQSIDIVAGAWLAWYLHSAVGLIIGLLVGVLAEVVFSFLLFPQLPNPFRAKFRLVGKLYQETKFIIGNGILHYLTENLDDLVIGKVLGTAGLGLYHAAYRLSSAVTNDFGAILGQVLYPVYAKKQAINEKVTPLMKKSSLLALVFYLAVGAPLLVFTRPIISLALGDSWLEIVPAVRLLFLAGAIKSFATSWNPLAILAEYLHHHVILNILTIIIMVAGIIWLSPVYGVAGAALAVLIAVAAVQPYAWIITYRSLRKLDHGR